MIQGKLKTDIDHVMRILSGKNIVSSRVVMEQVHGELEHKSWVDW